MSREKLRQEYKAHWEAELKRREQLNQAIGLPITLISGLGGAGYILGHELQHPLSSRGIAILLFVALSWLCLSGAVAKLMKMIFGHVYAFPPTPKSLEENRTELEDYYRARNEVRTAEDLDAELLERLQQKYIDDTHQNASCNDLRSANLYDCKKLIVLALASIAVAGAAKATDHLSLINLRADFSAILNPTGDKANGR